MHAATGAAIAHIQPQGAVEGDREAANLGQRSGRVDERDMPSEIAPLVAPAAGLVTATAWPQQARVTELQIVRRTVEATKSIIGRHRVGPSDDERTCDAGWVVALGRFGERLWPGANSP